MDWLDYALEYITRCHWVIKQYRGRMCRSIVEEIGLQYVVLTDADSSQGDDADLLDEVALRRARRFRLLLERSGSTVDEADASES